MSFINLSKKVHELRIHFCQTSPKSQGVRDFLTNQYMPLKKANPMLPVMIREANGISAKIFARFDYGEEKSLLVDGLTSSQIQEQLSALVKQPSNAVAKH